MNFSPLKSPSKSGRRWRGDLPAGGAAVGTPTERGALRPLPWGPRTDWRLGPVFLGWTEEKGDLKLWGFTWLMIYIHGFYMVYILFIIWCNVFMRYNIFICGLYFACLYQSYSGIKLYNMILSFGDNPFSPILYDIWACLKMIPPKL